MIDAPSFDSLARLGLGCLAPRVYGTVRVRARRLPGGWESADFPLAPHLWCEAPALASLIRAFGTSDASRLSPCVGAPDAASNLPGCSLVR